MKWEDYSSMSVDHQKEFDYRFEREKDVFIGFNSIISTAVIFILVVTGLLLVIFMVYSVPELSHLRSNTQEIFDNIRIISQITGGLIASQLVGGLLLSCFNFYKKNKWLKERGYKK